MPQGLSRRKDQVEGQARSFVQGGSLHGHHALDFVEPHAQGASQSAGREHLRLSDEAQAHCSWLAKDALRRRLLHCGKSESVAKRRFPLPTTDAKAQPTDTQVFDSQGWSEEAQSGAIPRHGVPPIRQGENRRTDWVCFRATR